jgi:hypothetical protein
MKEKSVLICGKSGTGKSTCLKYLDNPEGVLYLNCEGKPLPFNAKFMELTVTEPEQVFEALAGVETMPQIHTVVIDSLTFLMDMFESKRVNTAQNTMKGWASYGEFIRTLCLDYLNKCTKNVIVLAHVGTTYNEQDMVSETKVSVKGAIGKHNGVESYFTTVLYTKVVDLSKLPTNNYLKVTPTDEFKGCKHVFQTMLTKDSTKESIKSPDGLFDISEVYIDNNAQYVFNKLEEFYKK